MITITNISFWIYFIYFFIAVFFAFFIPGDLLVKRLPLSYLQRITLALVLGIVLWAYQGFIFGFLHLRFLTYLYLFVMASVWLKSIRGKKFSPLLFKEKDLILFFLIIFGTLLLLTETWATGLVTRDGILFCCGAPDSLFHLALTNQIVKHFPPNEGGMTGVIVQNYHYFTNLVIADLVRVFRLPLINSSYPYFSILISILFGLSAVTFSRILALGKVYTRWLIFFLYFSGDILYVLLFFLKGKIDFGFSFLYNSSDLWFSPPRIVGAVVFFGGLSFLILWFRTKRVYTWWLAIIVFVSLIGFKIYIASLAIVGLMILGAIYLFKKKYSLLWPLIAGAFISLLIYLPVNSHAGGIFFVGFWRFENFMTYPQLGLINMELARIIYSDHHNWLRVVEYESIYIFLYVFFIFGTLLLGLVQTRKSLSLFPKELNLFLLSGIGANTVLGAFFLQKVGIGNTSQFLITVMIVGAIYTALACYHIVHHLKRSVRYILIVVIVLLTIPRVLYEAQSYATRIINSKGYIVGNTELNAIEYMKGHTKDDAVIMVQQGLAEDNMCYYLSFMLDRNMFVCGSKILEDHGVNTKHRLTVVKKVFSSMDVGEVKELLLANHIDYLYITSDDKLKINEKQVFLQPMFSNNQVRILKIVKHGTT